MAEQADALVLETKVFDVRVQVSLPGPNMQNGQDGYVVGCNPI